VMLNRFGGGFGAAAEVDRMVADAFPAHSLEPDHRRSE
jgi:hypothetical protein